MCRGAPELLQRFFTSLGRGDRIDAMLAPPRDHHPSIVLARAMRSRACPRWFDGEQLELDDPELGVLAVDVQPREPSVGGNCVHIDPYPADDLYRTRLAGRRLLRWLRAHSDARVSTASRFPLRIHFLRRATHSIVCVIGERDRAVPSLPDGPSCFRISPAAAQATIEGRLTRRGDVRRVFLELDGARFRLTQSGLEPTAERFPRVFSSQQAGAVDSRARVPPSSLRIEPTSAFAPMDVLDRLHLVELSDRCIVGEIFCCVVEGHWSCADVSLTSRLGTIDPATLSHDEGVRFESDHTWAQSGQQYHNEEGSRVLHLLARRGDALIEAGSLELGEYLSEESWGRWFAGGRPFPPGGRQERIAWSYRVRSARCVEYLGATRELRTRRARTRSSTQAFTYGDAVDRLPRVAPTIDVLAAMAAWLQNADVEKRDGIVRDRRGAWALRGDRWTRVARCAE